jgi:gliding motility-associated-like protein
LVDGNLENYTFQLNNHIPQNSNIFPVNQGGDYTITISDTRGCHVIKKNVTIWQYPKFFTPNGDGFNDFWSIKTQKTININIFDRFGNLIKNLKRNQSWDGLLQGKPMPATDYWFVIEYQKNNETRIFKGHFGLKR